MGEVWKANHRGYFQKVALKFPRPEHLKTRAQQQRFRSEAETMAALRHPHFVRILNYDPGTFGRPYVVMEFLPGKTLKSIVHEMGPFPAPRAVYVLRQICSALAELHQSRIVARAVQSMVHRDIKPTNIMICNFEGTYDFVKVLDMGIAHHVRKSPPGTEHGVAGTALYMSPEQWDPCGALLDGRSDIFSVGRVGLFLLLGKTAFAALNLGGPPFVADSTLVEAALCSVGCPRDLQSVVLRRCVGGPRIGTRPPPR